MIFLGLLAGLDHGVHGLKHLLHGASSLFGLSSGLADQTFSLGGIVGILPCHGSHFFNGRGRFFDSRRLLGSPFSQRLTGRRDLGGRRGHMRGRAAEFKRGSFEDSADPSIQPEPDAQEEHKFQADQGRHPAVDLLLDGFICTRELVGKGLNGLAQGGAGLSSGFRHGHAIGPVADPLFAQDLDFLEEFLHRFPLSAIARVPDGRDDKTDIAGHFGQFLLALFFLFTDGLFLARLHEPIENESFLVDLKRHVLQ